MCSERIRHEERRIRGTTTRRSTSGARCLEEGQRKKVEVRTEREGHLSLDVVDSKLKHM